MRSICALTFLSLIQIWHPDLRACLNLYTDLNPNAAEGLWAIKSTMHLSMEQADYQTTSSGDPALLWCYAGETFAPLQNRVEGSEGMRKPHALSLMNRAIQLRECHFVNLKAIHIVDLDLAIGAVQDRSPCIRLLYFTAISMKLSNCLVYKRHILPPNL